VFGRTKVYRREDGVLYGTAGDCAEGDQFKQWVADGEQGRFKPSKRTDGIIVRPNGDIFLFNFHGTVQIRPPYYAMGSGLDFALGAMFAGADAIQAVQAAIQHNEGCGGQVHWVSHDGEPPAVPARILRRLEKTGGNWAA
jgi:ATP-dependent HslUV protease subunit HslV